MVIKILTLTLVHLNCWPHRWIDGQVSHLLVYLRQYTIDYVYMVFDVKSLMYFLDDKVDHMQIDRWLKTFFCMLHLWLPTIDYHKMAKNCVYPGQQMWLAPGIPPLMLYYHKCSQMNRAVNVVQSFEIQIWQAIWKIHLYEMSRWYVLHFVKQSNRSELRTTAHSIWCAIWRALCLPTVHTTNRLCTRQAQRTSALP